ncbi:MAG: HEAT repeat domain-containing protein [Candidatus Latescibacteria bacterium]|nr:HEAT repeat domain-containing protein [Candidatus Latescibacterota bacterium]
MPHRANLLNNARMREFIANGYVTVTVDFPPEFHASIYRQIEEMVEKEGNPGNNLLPRIPEIQDIFDHPTVQGALTSVLGPDCFLHPHRYCHFNPPGSSGQHLHKDSWTKQHHRTRWGMAFYYPQDVTEEMGPTGVTPGSQYYNTGPGVNPEVPLCGEAGTVTIVHYDLWHRAMPNYSEKKRYMVKFLFTRLEEPTRPSWNAAKNTSSTGESLMWRSIWDWYCGAPNHASHETAGDGTLAELIQALRSESETACLQAGYALGAIGPPAVSALIEALRDEPETGRRNAGYALSAIGPPAVSALIDAAHDSREWTRASAVDTLGDIGRPAAEAAPVVMTALRDESDRVRRHAAEALGTMPEAAQAAIPALVEALRDRDEWVRRNAALTFARMGKLAESATPALIQALRDDNRYVRAKAAKALERIGTRAARTAVFRFFETSRWCPITTKENPY